MADPVYISVFLPFPPSGNRYHRRRRRDGRIYVSKEAMEYRRTVALLARGAGAARPLFGRVVADFRFYYPPRSWARDLNNCRKILDDACEGSLWLNDRQIKEDRNFEMENPEKKRGVLIYASSPRFATRAEVDAATLKRQAMKARGKTKRGILSRATPAVYR